VDTEISKTKVTRVSLPALWGSNLVFSMELQEVDALSNPSRRDVHSIALPSVARLEMRQVLAVQQETDGGSLFGGIAAPVSFDLEAFGVGCSRKEPYPSRFSPHLYHCFVQVARLLHGPAEAQPVTILVTVRQDDIGGDLMLLWSDIVGKSELDWLSWLFRRAARADSQGQRGPGHELYQGQERTSAENHGQGAREVSFGALQIGSGGDLSMASGWSKIAGS
jgi:hypothetical protein